MLHRSAECFTLQAEVYAGCRVSPVRRGRICLSRERLWAYRSGMIVLRHQEVHRVRHLFSAQHLALVIDAVIAGNSPARVWADDPVTPRTAMAWDGAHCIYLVGAPGHHQACRELFGREIAPAGQGVFKLYASEAAASAVFTGYPLRRRDRVLYRGDGSADAGWRQRIPAGFQVSAIGAQLAELRGLGNFAEVTGEIESCWNSIADFQRAGFGFCAHDAGTIVCWCTAEYVSDGQCGIGIETVAAYRGRGFATLTASAFAEHCAERGTVPHWDSWSGNLASVAVAEKLGFHKTGTCSVSVGSFGEARPAR
jgi:RimJ/RimL family protein N-acetyltransferase